MLGSEGNYVWVHFDSKQWAESDCQPHKRPPAVKADVVKRRVGAAIRRNTPQEKREEIHIGDQFLLFDAGKDGIDHLLCSGFIHETTGKTMDKAKLKVTVLYTQASQTARTGQKAMYATTQQEGLLLVSQKQLVFDEKERKHFPGTSNWSSYIGPLAMAPVESLWHLTVKEKVEAYGPFIAPAGGKQQGPPDTHVKMRNDAEKEPVCWHSSSVLLYDSLIHDYKPKAIIDLTCTDGLLALAALKAKIPYTGLCPTTTHATLLRENLVSKVFDEFQQESEPLHEPSLVIASEISEHCGHLRSGCCACDWACANVGLRCMLTE